jgi:hypothetical protein
MVRFADSAGPVCVADRVCVQDFQTRFPNELEKVIQAAQG